MTAKVRHADLWGERQRKYDWLNGHRVANTDWTELAPQAPSYWFVPRDMRLEAEYGAGWKITDAMPVNSVSIVTARDSLAIQFTESEMWGVVQTFARMEPEEARRHFRLGPDAQDWKVKMAQQDVNDSGPHRKLVLPVLYRPFDIRYTYFTGRSRGFICRPRPEVMSHMLAGPNVALTIGRAGQVVHQQAWDILFCTSYPTEFNLYRRGGNCLFPLYLYGGAKSKPRSNLSTEFIAGLSRILKLNFVPDGRGDLERTFGPEDVFAFIYAVFHSPTYRTRYAEFLKIDFPRVPLTSNLDLFRALCEKGQELVDLHLIRDKRLANASFWGTSYPVAGKHDVTYVDYRPPGESREPKTPQSAIHNPQSTIDTGRVYINKKQPKKGIEAEYFEGVSPDVWEFRIGGYQVLDHWLKERKRHKRALTLEDIEHFQKVVAVLRETIRLMAEIDAVIDAHGGWPDAFDRRVPAQTGV